MAVTQSLHENIRRDTPPLPDYVNHYVLDAEIEQGVTPPDGAAYAWFRASTADVYFTYGVPEIPVSDVTNGQGSFLLPQDRPVAIKPGVSFSLLSEAGSKVSIGYYRPFTTL